MPAVSQVFFRSGIIFMIHSIQFLQHKINFMENDQSKSSAKEVVLSFIDNLNKENFDAARECISDGLQFKGVMGSRDSGDAYMKDMEKMRMKYDLKKVFEDGNDVCVFSDITQAGVT